MCTLMFLCHLYSLKLAIALLFTFVSHIYKVVTATTMLLLILVVICVKPYLLSSKAYPIRAS
ncbi:hypothetical protein MtrunA17_Chr7g0220601 [Medicago truncatula]|uniref:Transmembrane protein n=1 Tax=Medicago truncatula TaxID=3880 RepID=A0A396GU23_MEDTR|nr:hypothetical protein MtrunA17_Chr7g0220601 [Medicago truncatula]